MKNKRIICFLSTLFILICAFAFTGCSDNAGAATEITSASLKNGEIKLAATLDAAYAEEHSAETVYLLELTRADPTGSLKGAELIAESKVKAKMSFSFSSMTEYGISRISSAFVLAERAGESYTALTEPFFIEDPHKTAEKAYAAKSTFGIKGIATEDVYASKLLGAEHILLEAEMNKLMLHDHMQGAVSFNLDGVTYYYDPDEVERLDKLISDAEAASMRVYLRTVLRECDKDELSFLYCNGAKNAYGYIPDLSDEAAVRYVKAFYAFLASRYPVADFIIGERVNIYGSYCNSGKLSTAEFEQMYSFWARLSHQMLKSVNSEAVIFIPVDNTWRADAVDGRIGAKVFLSRFADAAISGGNYDYGVALDLCNGDDRAALLSGVGNDLSKIGAASLSDVVKFLDSAEMKYKDEKRELIIDGLKLSTSVSEKDRASYYTYTYYSAASNGISAFFYSGDVLTNNGARSELYYAILMCGTDKGSQLKEYTDRLTNAEIIRAEEYVTSNLTFLPSPLDEVKDSAQKNRRTLAIDLDNIRSFGKIYNVQGVLDSDLNRALIIEGNTDNDISAICVFDISAKELLSARYIGITASADKPQRIKVMLSSGNRLYIAEAELPMIEDTFYFDINEFAKDADRAEEIALSICFLPNDDGDASVRISDIFLLGSSASRTETILVILVVAITSAAVVALIVLLFIKRTKRRRNDSEGED